MKGQIDIPLSGHGGLYFWMQRVAEEHRQNSIKLIKRADTLHYQTYRFGEMTARSQQYVIKELIEDMKKLGWQKSIDEYFKEST